MKGEFYVYIYLDPRKSGKFTYGEYVFDYEPIYIGKGKLDAHRVHLRQARSNGHYNIYKIQKIRKILNENMNPIIIKYKEHLDEKEALKLEIRMIKTIGRNDMKNGPLTNLTEGGEGVCGYRFTKEDREKMRANNSGCKNPMFGKTHTKEVRAILRENHIGLSNHMWGKHHSEETLEKMKDSHKNMPEYMKIRRVSGAIKYWTGKRHTTKTKKKMSNTRTLYWKERRVIQSAAMG